MVHFAPCTKEITAEGYAQLFIDTVFRHHGMPEVIISDRDPRFISRFWKSLMNQLGADVRYSTAFHPQTDGQSEVTIRVMENFLRPYVERYPSSWSTQLSIAEFAANNVVNASTGYTPFYLNTVMHPVVPSSLLTASTLSTTQESVSERVTRLKDAIHHAQEQLKAAQFRMKRQADKTRREVQLKLGEEVVLSTKYLRTYAEHLPVKLRRRWVGPFRINKIVSSVAYGVDLPANWHIHPVFHVSRLKKFHRSAEFVREVSPPPPDLVEGHLEYEVESIARHRGEGARAVIWLFGRAIRFMKHHGSLNRIWRMLLRCWRSTCSAFGLTLHGEVVVAVE